MSALGESVIEAINFLDEFNADISRQLKTVESSMSNDEWVPYSDAGTFWYYSRAYYSPNQWIPRSFSRIYVTKNPENEKPDRTSQQFRFFSACLKPKNFKQPVAIWGAGEQIGSDDVWDILDSLGFFDISSDILPFLFDADDSQWQKIEPLPQNLSDFRFRSTELTNLNSAKTIKQLVTNALLSVL